MIAPGTRHDPGRRGRRWVAPLAALAILALAPWPGGVRPGRADDAGLIVDRVRVPSGRLGEVFKPGTEISILARPTFEKLAADASAAFAASRKRARREPRLLRAEHQARWVDGRLVGRSILFVAGDPNDSSWLDLDPWSPAALAADDGKTASGPLRTDRDGQVGLPLDHVAETRAVIDWEQTARPGSAGRAFRLGLPSCSIARLDLELPDDLTPEGWPGLEAATPPSVPSRPATGRVWRFEGPIAADPVELRLIPSGEDQRLAVWVGGSTVIEAAESQVRLTARWTVERPAGAADRLRIELSDGLIPLAVEGPAVLSWNLSSDPAAGSRHIEVRLQDTMRGGSPLTLKALASIPERGLWSLPWLRPLDVVWMGGRVAVRSTGPGRQVRAVERATGPPVAPRPDELEGLGPSVTLLVFDPPAAGPVADLMIGPPEPRGVAEVRGQVTLGPDRGRLEASLRWTLDSGPLLDLGFDLPEPWVIESVLDQERKEAIAWEVETRADGLRRVRLIRAPLLPSSRPFGVSLVAVSSRARLAGDWDLPRIRPHALPVSAERWSLRVGPGLDLEVAEAGGLAWERSARPTGDDAVTRLDWSWTEDDAHARIRLLAHPEPSSALAVQLVRLGRQSARIDLFLATPASNPLDPAAVAFPDGPPLEWDLLESKRDTAPGTVAAVPAPGPAAMTGDRAPAPAATPLRHLRASARLPWTGAGRLPIIALPEGCAARVLVLVALAPDLLATDHTSGLIRLDPAFARESIAAMVPPGDLDLAPDRLALAFEPRTADPVLDLATEGLEPCGPGGVIVQARSIARPGGARSMTVRTTLLALPLGVSPLAITLPESARLLLTRVDGRSTRPRRTEGQLLLTLTPASGLNPLRQVVLEWEAARRPDDATLPAPIRFDWPTIDPSWRVDLGPDDRLESVGPGWVATEPATRAGSDLLARLADLAPSWRFRSPFGGVFTRPGTADDRPDPRASAQAGTLGTILLRRDARAAPLLIDRAALESLGLNAGTPTGSSAADPLRALGLAERRVDGLFVLGPADRPPDPGGDPAIARDWLRQAAIAGASPTGRFLDVSRWLVEPEAAFARNETPAPRASASTPDTWLIPTGSNSAAPSCRIRDEFAARMRAVGLAILVLLGAAASRRASARRRLAALIVPLLAAVGLAAVATTEAAGLLLGASLALAFWLGSAAVRPATPRPKPTARALAASRSQATVRTAGLTLALLLTALPVGHAQKVGVDPADDRAAIRRIVAVSLADDPDRVFLRRADFDDLRDLAATLGADPAASPGRLTALTGSHRLARDDQGGLIVESLYDLALDGGDGPTAWTVPTGGAQDFATSLDGRPVPLELDPSGGGAGRVWIAGRGPHRLSVRRAFPASEPARSRPWVVPISPTPDTRVTGAEPEPILLADHEGKPLGADTLRLGPVDALTVLPFEAAGSSSRPLIDGLILWDAQAAGELLRVRWNVRCAGPVSRLRIALPPEAVVRAASVPGLVDARRVAEPARSVWTARIDPPWSGTQTIQLDVWMPTPAEGRDRDRVAPRLEPLDVEGYTGMIGLRRPGSWTGRLDATAAAGAEVVADEVFARAWGAFPDSPATFAGAIRFSSAPSVRVPIGPVAPSATVQTRLTLQPRPGRLVLNAEMRVSEREGRLREVELRIPPDLRINRIQGDGLEVWSRPASDRLILRLEGSDAGPRAIRIDAWRSVPGRPLAPATGRERATVPWPRPIGLTEGPLEIQVIAPSSYRVELRARADGPALVPFARPAAAGAVAIEEATANYLLATDDEPAPVLSWIPEAPSPNVDVVSVLTVHPTHARWRARLVSEGGPGPLPALAFTLPRDWAGSVAIRQLGASPPARRAELDGQTLFTIEPARPTWERLTIDLEAVRPWDPAVGLSYPELVPRGPGTATTTMAVANATGGDLVTQGEGIAAIQLDSDLPFPHALPAPLRAGYRVTRAGGSLTLRGEQPRANPDLARVIDADLLARVGDSGSTLGTLRARLLDDPAAFVAIHATTDLESLAALVDAAPVRPLRAGDGRLLIPLPIRSTPTAGAPRPALVELAWRFKPPAGAGAGATRVLDLPSAGSGVPHRVEIHTTDDRGATGRVALDGFEPASAFDLEWGRAFAMRRGLSDRLERLDRSRPADRTALLEGLIRFLIQLRAAERALDQGDPASNEPPRSAGLDRIRALREDFDAELSASGLDDLAQSARSRVGLEVADPLPALDPRIAGPMSFPIRTVGAARRFQGVGPDRTIPMSLAPPKRTGPRVPDIDLKPAASLAAALGLVALLGLSTRSRALAALAACLVAIGLAWVFPALLASVVATLALGALVEATRDRLADA